MKTPGELIEEGIALIAQGLFRTSEQNGPREARLLCDAVKATLSVMWMDLARQETEAQADTAEAGRIVNEVLETLKSPKPEQTVTEEPGTIERHDFGSKAGDPDWCYLCGEHHSHPAHAESQRPYSFTLVSGAVKALEDALRGLLKAYENAFDWSVELPPETVEAERIANEVLHALASSKPEPVVTNAMVKALRNIDAEAPAKEPRDDWTSTDLDEAFYEGKLRGFWEMAVYAREALAQEGK